MAHSYTPGLKVLKNTKILKERRLPLKGSVSASIGSELKPDEIIARTDLPGNVQMVNVANLLNVDASDIKQVMLKDIGSKIDKNDLILMDDGLIKLTVKKISTVNKTLHCKVIEGGLLSSNKGFEVEGKIINKSGVRDEDKEDIKK